MNLEKVFTPIEIGTMKLKNRIAMAPMTLGLESQDGTISEELSCFWEERAKGGVGLIIVDAVTVDGAVPYLGNTIGLHHDKVIPTFKKFVDNMHKHQCKVIPQITHPGPESMSWTFGVAPVGPSAYPNQFGKMVRELGIEEIQNIIQMYGDAAKRAREAGCDGVQLHCAHAYMLAGSFLSPLRNKRTDKYGGDLDGRATFVLEVIRNMKKKAGEDYPIVLRISGDEKTEGGNTLSDMLYLIPKFIEAGVDAFEVSGGTQYETFWKLIPCHSEGIGVNVPQAAAIKNISSVPVFVVGKINDLRYAEHIISNNEVDGVVIGRALLADEELPNKSQQGKFEDIAPCTGCGVGCISREGNGRMSSCVINPTVGREREMKILPADKKKKVLIIGGGIAGMEAARVSAIRGHVVTLFEKEAKLGGQINLAAVPPLKQDISKWGVYLSNQIHKLGVKVEFNKEGDLESIKNENADVIILATGAKPFIPNIKGMENIEVVSGNDILSGKKAILAGRVLIIGGGLIGCEVADTLYKNSRGEISITIVEQLEDIAKGVCPNNKAPMIKRLYSKGMCIYKNTKVKEILGSEVVVERNGEENKLSGFNHIVFCCGSKSINDLGENIKEMAPEVYVIGDAKSPRKALQAIEEAAMVGRRI